jgi:N-methylhydantoinase A
MSWVVVATTGGEASARLPEVQATAAPEPTGAREIVDTRTGGTVVAAVYDRRALAPGARVSGPCLIVEAGTTTYVSARFDCTVDAGLALVLTAKSDP